MTIETTTNEQPTPRQMAEAVVNNATPNAIIEEVERLIIDRDYYKLQESLSNVRYSELSKQLSHWKNSITSFLKEFIDSDDITTDDLKEFAEKMDIELTKKVRITFNVAVEYQVEVPLGSEDDIDESDFDIRVDYEGDGEVSYDNFSIGDFDTEEVK